ncbi:MAG TPA: diaminopimelate epimerase [Thermoanaerobaculia bacterium]
MRNLASPAVKKDGPPEFFKMAGGGNDFVVIDHRAGGIDRPEELAKKVCRRRLSVGADGIILIESSTRATFRMRYFNADGTLADFCANGTRCAARFAFLNVIAPKKMTIETGYSIVPAEIREQHVTLTLQPPLDFTPSRPLRTRDGVEIQGSFIMVGVPHYVIDLEGDLWTQNIDALGRELRHHPDLAPQGANVNFVVVLDRANVEVRTWERGVEAETLSCGSGVVASTSVSALFGRVDSPVTVKTLSGISFVVDLAMREREIDEVRLTGDARVIYKSRLTPETVVW